MKVVLHVLVIVSSSLLIGCTGCRSVPTPDPKTDIELCDEACANLQALGCEEGNDINMPDGSITSCTQFCIDTANSGHWLNPRCLSTLTSCAPEDIEQCGVHEQ